MNKKRIENLLLGINNLIKEDYPTNSEYLVLVANLLRAFAIAHIEKDAKRELSDYEDSFLVESLCYQYPDNPGYQLLLQSHVLLKISEVFSNDG